MPTLGALLLCIAAMAVSLQGGAAAKEAPSPFDTPVKKETATLAQYPNPGVRAAVRP